MAENSSSGRPSRIEAIAAFLAIYLIWGSTFLAIRFALDSIPPLFTAATRHLVAGSLLLAWALLERGAADAPGLARRARARVPLLLRQPWAPALGGAEGPFGNGGAGDRDRAGHRGPALAAAAVGSKAARDDRGPGLALGAASVALLFRADVSAGQGSRWGCSRCSSARRRGRSRHRVLPQAAAGERRDAECRVAAPLRLVDVARRRVPARRASRLPPRQRLASLARRPALPHLLRLADGVQRVLLASQALRADAGGDAHVRESDRGGAARVGVCRREAHRIHRDVDGARDPGDLAGEPRRPGCSGRRHRAEQGARRKGCAPVDAVPSFCVRGGLPCVDG